MKYFAATLWAGTLCASFGVGALLCWAHPAVAASQAAKASAAFAGGETLRYKLLWPSGVSMGEAVFVASPSQGEIRFELNMEADLPVYKLSGSFTSVATRDGLCSLQYRRKIVEGAKTAEESIDFDPRTHQARRTIGGQTSTLPIPECARDPLTFLYYFRKQLAMARPVDTASFYLGPDRTLEIKSAGTETILVRGQSRAADKFTVTHRGPRRTAAFDLWVAADAAREPVLIRLPSTLAVFSAELE